MNALCYKVIFSKRLGALVAVGENATSQGKSASGAACRSVVGPTSIGASSTYSDYIGALKSLFIASTLACVTASPSWAAPAANALPTNGVVQTGAATVSTNGAAMTINQSTQRASINWNSFSIGKDASVNVVQNNASSVLLNRVVGNDPSQIFGKLTANGQVILINPNGIVFGKGGSVTASAFTASTFGMTEEDFKKGKYKYRRNGSTAGVTVEEGASINTTVPGGYIALIASTVSNHGNLATKQGPVIMAAAETVTLPSAMTDSVGIPLSGKVRLELDPSTINASVENGGTITTEGGQVLMQAAAVVDAVSHVANASVTNTGTIDTTGEQGGRVDLLADHGTVRVSGTVKANSTNGTAGGSVFIGRDEDTNTLAAVGDASGARIESKGGFVETSGKYLKVDGARVIAKDWLLDPYNIIIAPGSASSPVPNYSNYTASATSTILADDILANLNTTDVKISTGLGSPATPQDGNIVVNADLNYIGNTPRSLTLEANNGITVRNKISGNLNVNLNAFGKAANTADSYGVDLYGSIDTTGAVVINGTSYHPGSSAGWTGNRAGLHMNIGSSIKGASVTIDAKSLNSSAGTVYGAFIDHKTSITATNGDINFNGTQTGSAAGNAIFTGSNPGDKIGISWTATGKVSVNGDMSGNTNDSASAVALNLGSVRINAGSDVKITAQTATKKAAAIIMQYAGTGWNPAIKSGGDITIRSNQGSIALNNFDAADATTGLGITGKNITIDNTGGSVNSSGIYTKGTGQTESTGWSGVQLNGVAGSVVATGDVKIFGNSQSSTAGVALGAGIKGSSVTVDGVSNGGNGVYTGQMIESTSGNVSITGASSTNSALSINGAVKAQNNVTITGSNSDINNTNAVVYISKAVTATNGTLDISSDTAGATSQALILNGPQGAALTTTNQNIKLKSDSINIAGAPINAGTGTVTIENMRAKVNIDIGSQAGTSGSDVANTDATKRTLGLKQTELDQITAGKTVIGSTDAGSVKVSSAITTASDLELRTKANIDINEALTVGTQGEKNLTLNAGGQINQNANGKITANKLNLVGDSATVALATAANQVNQITAKVQSLSFKNGKALSIGDSNGTPTDKAIETQEGASIITTVGDLSINQAVSNSTYGDVILGAGTDAAANEGLDSNIKVGNTAAKVSNTSTGKTFLYTGSTSSTDKLVDLNSSLASLDLSAIDSGKQNADSNVTFKTGDTRNTIKDGADVQVMFREKIKIGSLTGVEVSKIYGDANTKDTAQAALLADTKTALKDVTANPGNSEVRGKAGTIRIANAALIDSLNGSLTTQSTDFSTSKFLKANETNAYKYGALTSNKYDTSLAADKVTVKVQKRALEGSISKVTAGYGDPLQQGTVSFTNKADQADDILATIQINKTGNTSTSGNLVAGTHTGIQFVSALDGKDAGNYTFANVKGDYVVTPKALTVTAIERVTTQYGTSANAGKATLSGLVPSSQGTDKVSVNVAINNTTLSTSNNINAGQYSQTATSIEGDDAKNYTFTTFSTTDKNYVVTPKSVTAIYSASSKVYDGSTKATVNGTSADIINGDQVSLAHTSANFNDATVANGKTVTVTGLSVTGKDAANYVVVNPNKTATTQANITAVAPKPPTPGPVSPVTPVKPVTPANPFQLASADDLTDEVCSPTSLENCYCEESSLNQGVDICYEPKTSGKGTAR